MEHRIFLDKSSTSGDTDLKKVLGEKYELWNQIAAYLRGK